MNTTTAAPDHTDNGVNPTPTTVLEAATGPVTPFVKCGCGFAAYCGDERELRSWYVRHTCVAKETTQIQPQRWYTSIHLVGIVFIVGFVVLAAVDMLTGR